MTGAGMSFSAIQLFNDLNQSPAFKAAIAEFVEVESKARTAQLRTEIRQGGLQRASVLEGELSLLEELQALLTSYGNRYRSI